MVAVGRGYIDRPALGVACWVTIWAWLRPMALPTHTARSGNWVKHKLAAQKAERN